MAQPSNGKVNKAKTMKKLQEILDKINKLAGNEDSEIDYEAAEILAPDLPGHKKCCICGSTDVKDPITFEVDKKSVFGKDKVLWLPKKCTNGHIYWPGGSQDLSKNPNLDGMIMHSSSSNYYREYFGDMEPEFLKKAIQMAGKRFTDTLLKMQRDAAEVQRLIEAIKFL